VSDQIYIVGPVVLKRLIATDPYARYISAGDKTYTHKNGQYYWFKPKGENT